MTATTGLGCIQRQIGTADKIIDIWLFKDKESYQRHTRELFGETPTTPFGYYSDEHRALIMNIATGSTGFSFTGADNASISHIVVDGDRWVVRCWNDTSHLSPTFSTAAEPLI